DPALARIGVVDAKDPRAGERDGGARLALEQGAIAPAPVVDLERDPPAEELVFRFVDRAGAAARDLAQKTERARLRGGGDDGHLVEAVRGRARIAEGRAPSPMALARAGRREIPREDALDGPDRARELPGRRVEVGREHEPRDRSRA